MIMGKPSLSSTTSTGGSSSCSTTFSENQKKYRDIQMIRKANESLRRRRGAVPAMYRNGQSWDSTLKGDWTLELEEDLQMLYDVDLESNILDILAQDLAESIDEEIMETISFKIERRTLK